MSRRNPALFRLSLAVLFGLYALCMAGGTPTSAAVQSAVVRRIVRHKEPASFASNSWTAGQLRCVSQLRMVRAVPRASASTYLFQTVSVITPDLVGATLARENALALGGAPRAPGPTRGPPAA